ncbi:Sodiumdependent serotonin transporterlike, partial [Caligus rogercresseyi]
MGVPSSGTTIWRLRLSHHILTHVLIVGFPMLLLEISLGQYSGLFPTRMFRNISPILTGVGFAMASSLIIHTVNDLAVLMWSSQARRLSGEDAFFDSHVLNGYKEQSLGNLGNLGGLSPGEVSIGNVLLSYGLLVTLTIRGFMADATGSQVEYMSEPWVWLEAFRHVFISMQLGLGVVSTFG